MPKGALPLVVDVHTIQGRWQRCALTTGAHDQWDLARVLDGKLPLARRQIKHLARACRGIEWGGAGPTPRPADHGCVHDRGNPTAPRYPAAQARERAAGRSVLVDDRQEWCWSIALP